MKNLDSSSGLMRDIKFLIARECCDETLHQRIYNMIDEIEFELSKIYNSKRKTTSYTIDTGEEFDLDDEDCYVEITNKDIIKIKQLFENYKK